ncbi:hypothetical protein AC579_2878 [Pseudocercospora musae]|uniref:Uncharacterized protein n=1 Tax=Pseudocercospora musae TaxID=113226 RepID=A0A139IUI8_9PEZI|nr:hypothetical protein AC579_2878 [Pseudocercospora musae]KXT18246.1 hypothetical protein AC579_2878 [Pseudocercospora musae]
MITKKQESTTKDQHVAHTATILRSAPDGNLKHFHQRPDSGACSLRVQLIFAFDLLCFLSSGVATRHQVIPDLAQTVPCRQTEAYPGSRNRSNQCEEWTEEWQHIR